MLHFAKKKSRKTKKKLRQSAALYSFFFDVVLFFLFCFFCFLSSSGDSAIPNFHFPEEKIENKQQKYKKSAKKELKRKQIAPECFVFVFFDFVLFFLFFCFPLATPES